MDKKIHINAKIIDQVDCISFDIFDTLLVRAVDNPKDVYILTAYECENIIRATPEQFVKERRQAAEKAYICNQYGEPTLDDIYQCLVGYTDEQKKIIREKELEIERGILHVNPRIMELYETCVKKQKWIIAVSDMYLPSIFLQEVLEEKGFCIQKIYVSCETLCNKRNGELFDRVKKEENLKTFFHIGDSWKSDYLIPIKRGWKAAHIQKDKSSGGNLAETLLLKSSQLCDGSYFFRLGYTVLGPVLFGFCHWLQAELQKMDPSTVLFFSRDGKIIKEAYDLLFPQQSIKGRYFHISRKAINVATLWQHPGFDQLKSAIEETHTCTIDIFLQRIGLIPQKIILPAECNRNKEYRTEEFWNDPFIRDLYDNQIKEQAIQNSKQQYRLFCQYLKANVEKGNLAIVDIGWRGSMQDRLEELLQTMKDSPIDSVHGYYMGIERDVSNKHGYLYQSTQQTPRKTIIDAGVGLFETLFLAREGTTTGYRESTNGAEPVLADYEITEQNTLENISEIHKGALDFIRKMCTYNIFKSEEVSPDICLKNYKSICMNPTKEDLNQLSVIQFNDTTNHTLVDHKGLAYYCTHPSELKTDYHKAPWKIGFLKRNMNVVIGFEHIYKLVKKGVK